MKKMNLTTTATLRAMLAIVALCCSFQARAHKFALVDMEYILKNIPAYERANEQLNQVSRKLHAVLEAQTRNKKYQSEAVFLSEEQKTKSEEAVVAKEKEAAELKKKYFGPEGELYKKRESLMAPIQEEIYNAVKDISDQKGYSLILDRASDAGIIFASPKIDISNEVLTKLGYN